MFVQDLSSKIPEFKTKHNYLVDKGLFWGMIKIKVRGFCVQYTKRRDRARRNTEKHLLQQIHHLMNLLKTVRSRENISKLYRLSAEYNTMVP